MKEGEEDAGDLDKRNLFYSWTIVNEHALQ